MVNEGEQSIKEKYKKEILEKDNLFVKDSFEELNFGSTGFKYFKTKSFLDSSKENFILIYHFILNVHSLLNKKTTI